MQIRILLLLATLIISIFSTAQNIWVEAYPAGCGNATGSAYAYPDGPEPWTIIWSPEPGAGQGTYHATGLSPGDYTVTITDGLGVTLSESFTIDAIQGLFTDTLQVEEWWTCNTDCNGMMSYVLYDVGPFGQEPYSFIASPELSVEFTSCCLQVLGMCEGPGYEVIVTDALGCASTLTVGPISLITQPQLLSASHTPSCPGGATGGIQLLFDQSVSVGLNDSLFYDDAVLHDLQGLAPATYQITAYSNVWCVDSYIGEITVEESATGCGTISGKLYADLDGDCIQGIDDPGIPYRTISISPAPNELLITGSDGAFSRGRLLGIHSLSVQLQNFDPLCPAALPVNVDLVQENEVVLQNIAMTPTIGADVAVQHMANGAAPGFEIPYGITVHNEGPYEQGAINVQFTFTELQSVIYSSITPATNTPGILTWNIPSMEPFSTWQVNMVLQLVPDPTLIGDTITFASTITPSGSDADEENNVKITDVPITGAYDPNDKRAWTSSGTSSEHYFPVIDEYIDYTVRFQNTGNAPAVNIFVLDTISTLLDATSLQLLGSSHSFEVKWNPGRVLRFDFPNIMLPDSVNNEPESHGYISFRLKPDESLTMGDVISNWADIFFDFNPPIRTNTTSLLVSEPTNINGSSSSLLIVYPNPAAQVIQIRGGELANAQWTIFGVDGREFLRGSSTRAEPVIDISKLGRGIYILEMEGREGSMQSRFVKE